MVIQITVHILPHTLSINYNGNIASHDLFVKWLSFSCPCRFLPCISKYDTCAHFHYSLPDCSSALPLIPQVCQAFFLMRWARLRLPTPLYMHPHTNLANTTSLLLSLLAPLHGPLLALRHLRAQPCRAPPAVFSLRRPQKDTENFPEERVLHNCTRNLRAEWWYRSSVVKKWGAP